MAVLRPPLPPPPPRPLPPQAAVPPPLHPRLPLGLSPDPRASPSARRCRPVPLPQIRTHTAHASTLCGGSPLLHPPSLRREGSDAAGRTSPPRRGRARAAGPPAGVASRVQPANQPPAADTLEERPVAGATILSRASQLCPTIHHSPRDHGITSIATLSVLHWVSHVYPRYKLNSKWSELNADASGEILKRLDVIDKLNFMCTCRSWFSLCCALKGNRLRSDIVHKTGPSVKVIHL
ncbi:formin-like protein 20 isoform X2 [Panicum virgatum]|uniref:formin-like protein 20 isoform X2 n=1 Tax=Panicum virgatum TaxID=38727 RepID=UPI0019D62FCB|nr:formin-like protein 20 isoform X2 [Panicum virgatum]